MKRKPVWERIGDVMAGKGFYIVLFLCVAAIGISGYYLLSNLELGASPVAGGAQVVVSPTPTAKIPQQKVTPTPTPTATPKMTAPPSAAPTATAAPTPTPKPRKTVYTWPLKGEVLSGFSLEVLAYDSTMGDWRTHSGIDLAAKLGTQVLSVAEGTVASVEEHDLMGTMVVINHRDGISSVYANLAATPTVKVGDKVEPGTVIGSVGSTALAESGRPSHLHLEMLKDGEPVDPVNYLPK